MDNILEKQNQSFVLSMIILIASIVLIFGSRQGYANPGGLSSGNYLPHTDCTGCHWRHQPGMPGPTFQPNIVRVDNNLSQEDLLAYVESKQVPVVSITTDKSVIDSLATIQIITYGRGGDGPVNGYFICALKKDTEEIILNSVDPIRIDDFFTNTVSVEELGFQMIPSDSGNRFSYKEKSTDNITDPVIWELQTPDLVETDTYYLAVIMYYGKNSRVENRENKENAQIAISNILEIKINPNPLRIATEELFERQEDNTDLVPVWRADFLISNHFFYGVLTWFLFTALVLLHIIMPYYNREKHNIKSDLAKDLIWSIYLFIRELLLIIVILLGSIILLNPNWIYFQQLTQSLIPVYSIWMIIGLVLLYMVLVLKIIAGKKSTNVLTIIIFVLLLIAYIFNTIGLIEVSYIDDLYGITLN